MNLFLHGVKTALPMAVVYATVGTAAGVMATEAGLSVLDTALISLFVYSGATQFAVSGLVAANASVLAIITTACLLTMRHTILAGSLATKLTQISPFQQAIMAFGVTDESYALAMGHHESDGPGGPAFIAGVMAPLYPAWLISSIMGANLGRLLPDPQVIGLDFAFPACFLGLVIPHLKNLETWTAGLVGAGLALIIAAYIPGSINLVAAGILGPLCGMAVNTIQNRGRAI